MSTALSPLLALALALAGCGSLPPPRTPFEDVHTIVADIDGRPVAADGTLASDAAYAERLDSMFRAADEYFGRRRSGGRRRILVHVQGGLNSPEEPQAVARELAPLVLDGADGDPDTDSSFPVFLTWDSGWTTALRERYTRLSLR